LDMEQPPVIQAELVTTHRAGLGRIGLYFSLASVAALAAMLLLRPG
jgi:hypothetical protein